MEERILRQRGFRWIIEALAGGDLSELEPGYFSCLRPNLGLVAAKNTSKEFADSLKQQLQAKRPVLVGHNLFTDLVNLCKCFFGALPDRVEDFQGMVHENFPVLVDTKYMATHGCGSINPNSSLSDINEELLQESKPKTGKCTFREDIALLTAIFSY
jgi:poly(A)-specific ribonuclease